MSTNLTYIGHSTVLIEYEGGAVLTDPQFSSHALIFKRHVPIQYDLARLPKLDAVLISHAHHDHLDLASFKYIDSSVPVFVPDGLGKFVGKFIGNPVIELACNASHEFQNGLSITAVFAKHTGFRWTGLRFRRCNGYVIDVPPTRIYFAGDTAYGPHFAKITSSLTINYQPLTINVALLPIAGYSPRWLMKGRHMTPQEAIQAFLDLGAKVMIPIHWGHFRISTEPLDEPITLLRRRAEEQGLTDRIYILEPGESKEFK